MTPARQHPAAAPSPSAAARETLADGAYIAAAVLAATLTSAVAVAVTAPARVRDWLAFGFTGLPRTLAEAAWILAHNLRVLGAVAGLVLLAALPVRTALERAVVRGLRLGGECLVAGMVAANVLVVGAALGAYGPRMLAALLPHGPVELAAFALALATYRRARLGRCRAGTAIVLLAASCALLAVAALLEVFAAP